VSTKVLEVSVERSIKRWTAQHKDNLIYWKFTVPGMRGVPDRVCLFRGGRCVFFELKRPGAKPRKLQIYVIKKLRAFGFGCHVFDSADGAIACLEEYLNGQPISTNEG